MAKVTALKVQARNKNRVNVYLDGEFAFGLVKIEAVRLRLGQELSESAVAALKSAVHHRFMGCAERAAFAYCGPLNERIPA